MKVLVLFLLCLVVTATLAKRDGSKRRDRERRKRINREEAVLNAVEEGMDDDDEEYDTVEIKKQGDQVEEVSTNPCNVEKCGRGEACILQDSKPLCICQPACPDEPNIQYRVCSTNNDTYESECHLDRDNCRCKRQETSCSKPGSKKIRLDYFGACKELSKCPQDEFDEFNVRMRDWLFRIMRDMANRQELDEYLDLLESAQHDDAHTDAVIWKFCDLDIHPTDRKVTRREMMYIIASIKPMEHCLVPFLNHCDSNNDNKITLIEWGTCLGIDHQHIVDKCQTIHDRRG